MAKYKYYLMAGPYGGEHTIGTIPKKVAEYWLDKGADAFDKYMLDDNHDKINNSGTIPEEYQLPIWYELNNISQVSSVIFCSSNTLTVLDVSKLSENDYLEKGKEVARIEMTNDMIGNSDTNPVQIMNEEYVVYGASNDTGFCKFELLETNEPFNASELKFCLSSWNKFKLVMGINYNGQDLANEGMEISTGQSMECWINIKEDEHQSSDVSISSHRSWPTNNLQSI
jgi:hypothetical protein